jgi:hypothetical protein
MKKRQEQIRNNLGTNEHIGPDQQAIIDLDKWSKLKNKNKDIEK